MIKSRVFRRQAFLYIGGASVGLLLFTEAHAKVGKDVFDMAQRGVEQAMTSQTASIREKAVAALGDVKFPDEMKWLKQLLEDGNEYVRIAAALSLQKKGDTSGKAVLQDILDHTPPSRATN